jgi:hypothetical protein
MIQNIKNDIENYIVSDDLTTLGNWILWLEKKTKINGKRKHKIRKKHNLTLQNKLNVDDAHCPNPKSSNASTK